MIIYVSSEYFWNSEELNYKDNKILKKESIWYHQIFSWDLNPRPIENSNPFISSVNSLLGKDHYKIPTLVKTRAWNRTGTEPRTQVLAKNRTRTGTQESRTRTEPEPKKLKRTEPKRTRVLLGSSQLNFSLNFY